MPTTTTTRFQVQGMTCAGCVARVEKAIRALPGVGGVTIDLPTGKATVEYDLAKVAPQQIRQAIVTIGYNTNMAA